MAEFGQFNCFFKLKRNLKFKEAFFILVAKLKILRKQKKYFFKIVRGVREGRLLKKQNKNKFGKGTPPPKKNSTPTKKK